MPALALVGETPTPTPTPRTAATKAKLRVAFSGISKQLDPAFYSVIEEYQLGFAIFDGLVWVDHTLTPQPMLAEAWESSNNLLQWTFKLRKDATFHHGTAFSAQDVVHTFTRMLDPQVGSPFRSTIGFIKTVKAIDDYTVRFQLASPSAELPLLLGAPQARIVPHDYPAETLATNPSGTGPFQLVSHSVGESTHLARNPAYWQEDRPLLDELEFDFMVYEQQSVALQRGQIDMIAQLGTTEFTLLKQDPSVVVLEVESGAYQNIVMRATERPFHKPAVREALKYCVDRQAMRQRVLGYMGVLGDDHPVSHVSPFWADLPLREYDPDRARSLLSRAGYPKGLQLDLITSTVRPGMEAMALAFKEMAQSAGVNIQVIRVPAQVYWSDYAGRVPFHTGNWGFRPSIDETFMVAYHSTSKGNESNWHDPALDALVDEARGERNREKRMALYQQAQKLLMEEGAVIIPYFKPTLMAMRSNVTDFTPHPTGWLDFRTTHIS